jgi:hypothetical protein
VRRDHSLVYVKYRDDSSGNSFRKTEALRPKLPHFEHLETVGWIIFEDAEQLVIANVRHCEDRDSTGLRSFIVKACIVERREMRAAADTNGIAARAGKRNKQQRWRKQHER